MNFQPRLSLGGMRKKRSLINAINFRPGPSFGYRRFYILLVLCIQNLRGESTKDILRSGRRCGSVTHSRFDRTKCPFTGATHVRLSRVTVLQYRLPDRINDFCARTSTCCTYCSLLVRTSLVRLVDTVEALTHLFRLTTVSTTAILSNVL